MERLPEDRIALVEAAAREQLQGDRRLIFGDAGHLGHHRSNMRGGQQRRVADDQFIGLRFESQVGRIFLQEGEVRQPLDRRLRARDLNHDGIPLGRDDFPPHADSGGQIKRETSGPTVDLQDRPLLREGDVLLHHLIERLAPDRDDIEIVPIREFPQRSAHHRVHGIRTREIRSDGRRRRPGAIPACAHAPALPDALADRSRPERSRR